MRVDFHPHPSHSKPEHPAFDPTVTSAAFVGLVFNLLLPITSAIMLGPHASTTAVLGPGVEIHSVQSSSISEPLSQPSS